MASELKGAGCLHGNAQAAADTEPSRVARLQEASVSRRSLSPARSYQIRNKGQLPL